MPECCDFTEGGDAVKAYVTTTGVLFGLLVLVHIWRAIVEGGSTFKDPYYVVITGACAGLAAWAWRVRSENRRD
jgi:hypothetical protein